jgi:hypothetical protein
MNTFVLYIEHDDGPHTVSVHESLKAARAALRDYAAQKLDGPLPTAGTDLINLLRGYSEYVRIYHCTDHWDDSEEVDFAGTKPPALTVPNRRAGPVP